MHVYMHTCTWCWVLSNMCIYLAFFKCAFSGMYIHSFRKACSSGGSTHLRTYICTGWKGWKSLEDAYYEGTTPLSPISEPALWTSHLRNVSQSSSVISYLCTLDASTYVHEFGFLLLLILHLSNTPWWDVSMEHWYPSDTVKWVYRVVLT